MLSMHGIGFKRLYGEKSQYTNWQIEFANYEFSERCCDTASNDDMERRIIEQAMGLEA